MGKQAGGAVTIFVSYADLPAVFCYPGGGGFYGDGDTIFVGAIHELPVTGGAAHLHL